MHVTLLLAPQCSAASASTAIEVLRAATLFAGTEPPVFELVTASLDGGPVATMGGVALGADRALSEVLRSDLVLIPGFLFTLRDVLPSLAAYGPWLREQHARGAVIASMCTASFMLAEAGLLDGARATTHWAFEGLFRQRYPRVLLDTRPMICEDRRLITSGGASAGMDLLLHLVRRHGSLALAKTCSRYLLLDPVRREQASYALWNMPKEHGDAEILKVQVWLESSYAQPLSVEALAGRFGFGERNFKRRFKQATGFAPLSYLQTLRVEKAKELLESTRLSLDRVTRSVGYEDSNSFRRLFQQRVGLAPLAYRKRFQARE